MSELNFNDLPEEMLITVFRLLDAANLNNATLTCKLWKNSIESACRWSLTLELEYYAENPHNWEQASIYPKRRRRDAEEIRRDAEQKMNFILTTNRKFETITISGGRLREGGQLLQIFRKHGFHVFNLRVCRVYVDNLIAFTEHLNFTPNLKYVDIRMQTLQDVSDVPDQVLPVLKRLTYLETFLADYRFFQCFRKAKLTKINICEPVSSERRGTLAPFILSQDMLTTLIVASYSDSASVLAEMGELDVPNRFRLTQLAISDKGGRNSAHDHNLLKFVKSQTNSITEMEIEAGVPSSVYECVFASMTKLNTLAMVPYEIPQDIVFYERLPENGNVCTLKLSDIDPDFRPLNDIQYLSNLLKKLPNIRNLYLSYNSCTYDVLVVAAQHLSKIELLEMSFTDEHLMDDIGCVNFYNLKSLHIGLLKVKINWDKLTKNHSQLVNLTIERIYEKSFLTSDIDEITTNVDLQNLKLGDGFVADDRFFEIIRIKCPNLKVFDLDKSCVSHGINYINVNNLLRLCDYLDCTRLSHMLQDK